MFRKGFLFLSVVAVTLVLAIPAAHATEEDDVYGVIFGSVGTFAELHGFVNVRYKDFEGKDSTFDTHQFYLSAIAKINPRVSIFGEVEYEHTGKDIDKQNIMVDRAFIDWQMMDADLLTLRFGTFNPPIGWELAEYYAPARKFESRPQFVDEVLVHEWVDTGVEIFGSNPFGPVKVGYDLAIINGTRDLYHNEKLNSEGKDINGGLQNNDNNNDRTFVGRIAFSPTAYMGGLVEVGVSKAMGTYSDSGPGVAGKKDLDLFDVDARWVTDTIDVRGEYAKGDSDSTAEFAGDSAGYFVQVAYKVIKDQDKIYYLEPVVRYESTDISSGSKSLATPSDYDEQSMVALGVNYSPYSRFLIRAEYDIIDRNYLPGKTEVDANGFMITAVVDF